MDTTTKNWRKILDGFAGDLDEIVTEEIEEFLQEKKRKKKKKKKKKKKGGKGKKKKKGFFSKAFGSK